MVPSCSGKPAKEHNRLDHAVACEASPVPSGDHEARSSIWLPVPCDFKPPKPVEMMLVAVPEMFLYSALLNDSESSNQAQATSAINLSDPMSSSSGASA